MDELPDYHSDHFEVRVSELLVSTSDASDPLVSDAIFEVLRLLRDRMKMDVVFVSEFTGGRRVFRHVSQQPGRELLQAGASDSLEASWCQRVVDGRLPQFIADAAPLQAVDPTLATPFPIGTHLSTPIVLKDGTVYGTLCCFSLAVNPGSKAEDMKRLRYTAQLAGDKLEQERSRQVDALSLTPVRH